MMLSFADSCSHSGQNKPSEAILFLNAFPLNQSMWDDQVAEFATTHRVVTFDWPGFGKSPTINDETSGRGMIPYAMAALRLLDHLSIDRAHICGLSMGGYGALALWSIAPQRIRSLILCDTRATSDNSDVRDGRLAMAAGVRRDGIASLADTMIPRLLGDSTISDSGSALKIVERIRKMISSCNPEGVARAQIAMAERSDSSDLLTSIGHDTGFNDAIRSLIIVGNEDKLTPPSEMTLLARAIPGSGFMIIEGAGHLPNIEKPLAFNRVMREFLESI